MSSPLTNWWKLRTGHLYRSSHKDGNGTRTPGSPLEMYLQSPEEEKAERFLDGLVKQQIEPTIRAVLRQRHILPADGEGLIGTVAMTVVDRLRRQRQTEVLPSTTIPPITHLEGYVAVVTHHAIDGWLRERSPERARLRRSLRYVLIHSVEYALWEQDKVILAGRASWQMEKRAVSPVSAEQLVQRCQLPQNALSLSLLTLVDTLFQTAGGPILLEALVEAAVHLRGVEDKPKTAEIETISSPGLSIEATLLHKETLAAVWREVLQLPQRQCVALLLNLRDNEGRGVQELLLALGITDRKGIALALGWREEELDRIWDLLPVDDIQIAQWLGITRQQVINLRKVARERLERRLSRSQRGESE